MDSKTEHVETLNDVAADGQGITKPVLRGIVEEAKEATSQEHSMSLWQGIKLYPKAIGWSVLLSTAIIMEGYGT